MRVLVLGGTGMLGHKLVQVLGKRFDVWTAVRGSFADIARFGIFDKARTIENVDAGSRDALRNAIADGRPDVVVNAIGIIKQLPEAADVEILTRINSDLPHMLAATASEFGFRLICISTDCVFSGQKGNYIEEDEPDATDVYGRSKLAGEVTDPVCLTIRTSMIGRELETTHSLVEWFLANRGGRVDGYTKAIYTGFPTIVLAAVIGDIIADHPHLQGLYHVSSDPISKFDLLRLVDMHFGVNIEIEPRDDFVIDRSLDSSRFRAATGFEPATWDAMVRRMAADPTPYDNWHRQTG